MEGKYTPMRDLLLALNQIVESSGLTLREVTRRVESKGMNLSNVCSMANGHPEQLSTVNKFDNYIHEILKATGHDEYDLIKLALEGLTNPRSKSYRDDLSVELRNFLRSPESEKYIQYAFKKYQLDKLDEEKERIRRELEEL